MFAERSRYVSFVRLANEDGIGPEKLQLLTPNSFKAWRLPIESSSFPEKFAPVKSQNFKGATSIKFWYTTSEFWIEAQTERLEIW